MDGRAERASLLVSSGQKEAQTIPQDRREVEMLLQLDKYCGNCSKARITNTGYAVFSQIALVRSHRGGDCQEMAGICWCQYALAHMREIYWSFRICRSYNSGRNLKLSQRMVERATSREVTTAESGLGVRVGTESLVN